MFIVFEGPDGTGKSTLARLVYEELINNGYNVYLTKEPTKKFKFILEDSVLNKYTKLLLFLADRINHTQEIINYYLKQNYIVISDRYLLSTYVYSSIIDGIDVKFITELYELLIKENQELFISPNLTIYVSADINTILERLNNKKQIDLHENKLLKQKTLIEKLDKQYIELINNITYYAPNYKSEFMLLRNDNYKDLGLNKKLILDKINEYI